MSKVSEPYDFFHPLVCLKIANCYLGAHSEFENLTMNEQKKRENEKQL